MHITAYFCEYLIIQVNYYLPQEAGGHDIVGQAALTGENSSIGSPEYNYLLFKCLTDQFFSRIVDETFRLLGKHLMIITDAHAHIYPCYNLDDFISSAFRNFFTGPHNPADQGKTAVLFLTETTGNNYFELLRGRKIHADNNGQSEAWTAHNTDEQGSLRINHGAFPDKEIILISGQQVVTEEKLEVLAIACHSNQIDGIPLKDTVRSISSGDGIVILPWGVGKWLGQRGRILDHFIATESCSLLFLGDNGSRPYFWPVSRLERCRKTKKTRLLSGTDPLPLPGEERRIGTFGSIIHGSIDSLKPVKTLKAILSDPETEITDYGDLQSSLSFLKQQVALRMAR